MKATSRGLSTKIWSNLPQGQIWFASPGSPAHAPAPAPHMDNRGIKEGCNQFRPQRLRDFLRTGVVQCAMHNVHPKAQGISGGGIPEGQMRCKWDENQKC